MYDSPVPVQQVQRYKRKKTKKNSFDDLILSDLHVTSQQRYGVNKENAYVIGSTAYIQNKYTCNTYRCLT